MVNDSNVTSTHIKHIDGVTPVDLSVFTDEIRTVFDNQRLSMESLFTKMEDLARLDKHLHTKNSFNGMDLLNYSLDKYDVDIPSCEDISESARNIWERNKISMRGFYKQFYEYSKIIMIGADRTFERVEMLHEMAGNVTTKPQHEEIDIKSIRRLTIDGEVIPFDIRPVLEQTQNTLDFYDKIFIPYLTTVETVLNNLSFDGATENESKVDFSKFNAKNWLKGLVPVEEDERFRNNAEVFRSKVVQGNRAIYYSGPTDTDTEKLKDWGFIVNTIRDVRLRFITVPGLKKAEGTSKFKVNSLSTIRSRLNILLGLLKRIQSRKNYDQKINTGIKKIESLADSLRSKAQQVNGPEKLESKPSVSNVIVDTTMILNNVNRMAIDYNNTLAGMIRLIASLAVVADMELKAYQPELKKPNNKENL